MLQILSIGLALFAYHVFFYPFSIPYPGAVGFFAVIALMNVCVAVAFFQKKKNFPEGIYFIHALSISASFLALFRASDVDQILLSMTSVFLWCCALYLSIAPHRRDHATGEVLAIPFGMIVGWFFGLKTSAKVVPTALSYVGSTLKTHREKRKAMLGTILRGMIAAIPVLIVLLALLSSADPIFSKELSQIFHIQIPDYFLPLLDRLTTTIAFLFVVAPIAYAHIESSYQSPFQKKTYGRFSGEIAVVIGLVAIVLATFLVVQFRYLFSTVSETELHQFGIYTYSEYVRKGFGELTLVTVLTYAIGFAGYLAFRQNRSKKLLVVNSMLIGEMALFVSSIFRRVVLYQAEHGLTRIRIYGSLFLILVFILAVILLIRHFVRRNIAWYQIEIGVVICMIFVAVTLNVDRLIATQFRPTVNGEIDYVYISRLSVDASKGWIEAYSYAERVSKEQSLLEKTEYTSDEFRRIWYARYIASELKDTMSALDRYDHQSSSLRTFLRDDYNIAEKQAYDQLKKELSLENIQKTYDTLNQMLTAYYQKQSKIIPTHDGSFVEPTSADLRLDRSLNSPLVR